MKCIMNVNYELALRMCMKNLHSYRIVLCMLTANESLDITSDIKLSFEKKSTRN